MGTPELTTPRLRKPLTGDLHVKLPHSTNRRAWLRTAMGGDNPRPEWQRDDHMIGGGYWVIPSDCADSLIRSIITEFGECDVWDEYQGSQPTPGSLLTRLGDGAGTVSLRTGVHARRFTATEADLDRIDGQVA